MIDNLAKTRRPRKRTSKKPLLPRLHKPAPTLA